MIAFAELCGWKPAHFRPLARKNGKRWETPVQGSGGKGFQDLTFRRDSGPIRVAVAELKSEAGTAEPEQLAWLAAFAAMGVPAFLWRPSDWPEIEKFLRGET